MKVKCIKDTIGFKKGETYKVFGVHVLYIKSNNDFEIFFQDYPEYFEEVKEENNLPLWKVGDYVVQEYETSPPNFIKIYKIGLTSGKSPIWKYNGMCKSQLRNPTEEELKLYYR